MSVRASLWLIFLAPLALLGGLYAFGLTLPVPVLGRDYVVRFELPPAGEAVGLPPVEGPQDKSRPLIVIDAGHGGHDPGASGGGRQEKDLVLGLARALRDRDVPEEAAAEVSASRSPAMTIASLSSANDSQSLARWAPICSCLSTPIPRETSEE